MTPDKVPTLRDRLPSRRSFIVGGISVAIGSAAFWLLRNRKEEKEVDDTVHFSSLAENETLIGKNIEYEDDTHDPPTRHAARIIQVGDTLELSIKDDRYEPEKYNNMNVTDKKIVKSIHKATLKIQNETLAGIFVQCALMDVFVEPTDIAKVLAEIEEYGQGSHALKIMLRYRKKLFLSNGFAEPEVLPIQMMRIKANDGSGFVSNA